MKTVVTPTQEEVVPYVHPSKSRGKEDTEFVSWSCGKAYLGIWHFCHCLDWALPQTLQKTRQKIAVPTLTRGTAISSQNRITVLYGSAWESRPNSTPFMFIILYMFRWSQISFSGKKRAFLLSSKAIFAYFSKLPPVNSPRFRLKLKQVMVISSFNVFRQLHCARDYLAFFCAFLRGRYFLS